MSRSIWWPTPVQASTWFSAEELARSRAYHQPLVRVAAARGMARLCGVGAAQWFVASLPASGPPSGPWGASLVVVVVVALLACAWWIPGTAADAWFEYVHEPRFGHEPIPPNRFAVSSFGTLLTTMGFLALVVIGLGALMALTRWWLVAVVAIVALAMVGLSKLEPAVTTIAHEVAPVAGVEDRALQRLASRAGVEHVSFEVLGGDAFVGINALTAGNRHNRRIAVTRDLLDCELPLRDHVVAHELGHLRCRHPAINLVMSIVTVVVAIVMAGLLGGVLERRGSLGALGLAGTEDPRAMPLLLGLLGASAMVLAPLVAWFHRAQERAADRVACDLSGPLPSATVRRLHVTERANLDPGFGARLFSSHPTPAERMLLSSLAGVGDSAVPSGRVR